MTIGGWLLTLEPGEAGRHVRRTLAQHEGVDCRMEGRGTLVVVTETPSDAEAIDGMRELLGQAPGVLRAELIARFEDGRPMGCGQ